ncbi:dephospho-CoA kinase [uncultured Flavobacterium sp.]|uniref:dephospho-CoA kinase n=1 Tax=uncultured Flavobacterium sp. TaxID=165435 RepID=UPI0030EF704F|tara:strand:+ start:194 stop:769 length:576 start_codon:yes stop_codon:yes gene_type:complete
MTKIIGLTGGIGSGKTTVANYLKAKGIPVYIADLEARKITESKKVINQIEKVFGVDVIENNKVNRAVLATIVFKDKEKLAQLNAIIHPEVKKHFKKWLKSKIDCKFVVKESAILFESGSYENCDAIILVTAPLETRIERTMKRDNVDRESVLQRINNQMPEEEKKIKSDYIIQNTSLKDTHIQLDELLNYL